LSPIDVFADIVAEALIFLAVDILKNALYVAESIG
jgi:hypothetical protein